MTGRPGAIAAVAIGVAAACGDGRATLPASTAHPGVAIAIYARADREGYAVIDDRRWVEVAGDDVVLDHVDPRAALPSLVIEPLADPRIPRAGALEIGACLRDRIPAPPVAAASPPHSAASAPVAAAGPPVVTAAPELAPVLRCAVHGPRGRALVRLLYVVPGPGPQLGYRAQHDVAMTRPDRATVASRFAIATPAWQQRAEIVLFDGMPGEDRPPHELARGVVMLDGSTSILAAPPRTVTARLRRIYDGAVDKPDDAAPRDPRWRHASHAAVWVWLELDDRSLAPGPVHARVELAGQPARELDVPARGRRRAGPALHLPLWIDDELRGRRDRWTDAHDGAVLTDRLAVSIANSSDAAREVWIEEPLRPGQRRSVRRAWPSAPDVVDDVLRLKLTVPAGKVERAGVEIAYER